MNAPHNLSRSSGARRAWAQPRFLLGAAAFTLAGVTFASYAAPSTPSKPAVAMPHTSSQGSSKLASLSDLPGLVARYGEARRLAATPVAKGGRTTKAIGSGQTGFNLVETDLTLNSASDEREPAVSPGGDFITFTSTGADTNNDGRLDPTANGAYRHIWIMNRDGSGARQLTGLGADAQRNQSHPTFSPDGNQIAYVDEEPAVINPDTNPTANPNAGGSQLFIVSSQDGNPVPTQRTFFGEDSATANNPPARVESPAWAPSGLNIAFVTNYDGRASTANNARILPTRDIFTIAPSGSSESLTRITGESGDPVGNTTDDDHPAYGIANTNLLFFSSNRDKNGLLTGNGAGGRRIWRIFADGTVPNPVTDPLKRSNGQASDVDDYPAPSVGSTGQVREQLAFQTNSFLDDSDQADGARGRDLNIWSIPLDTGSLTSTPEGRVFISSYDDGKVVGVNTSTLQPSAVVPSLPLTGVGTLSSPEGIAITQSSTGTNYVFVSDRGNNQIVRFEENTGTPAGSSLAGGGTGDASFTAPTIPNPTALALYGGFIYVASGYNGSGTTPNKNAFYRFRQDNGQPSGSAGDTNNTGMFSSGETTANGGTIQNGSEGLAIDSTGSFVAVSELLDNKINLYDRATGTYLFNATDNASLVPANTGGLSKPTGLVWGPDLNGDSFQDLYVCSSANDSIKVFAGPNPNSTTNVFAPVGSSGADRPGTLIATLVADAGNGTGPGSTGLNAPEAISIQDLAKHGAGGGTNGSDGKPEIYVSSFRTLGQADNGVNGGGYQVNRYELSANGASSQALPWPAGAPAPSPAPAPTDPMVNAAWVSLPANQGNSSSQTLVGAGGFAFNRTAFDMASGTSTGISPDEKGAAAQVLTNILSSPRNFTDSKLTSPQDVDRAADREPAFSRTTATNQTIARLVFVSGRRYSPNTTSNNSATPANPSGGDQTDAGVTHDIWTTSTQDTTPPALIPQGVGNLQTPVVAPQPDSPFFAPRTAEAGLKPNLVPTAAELAEITNPATSSTNTYAKRGGLRFAVVLRDTESGFTEGPAATSNSSSSVTVSLFNAKSPAFQTFNNISPFDGKAAFVNENQAVPLARELKAARATINNSTSFALNVYDDGPVANGGHEQQASAVAGDGNYYCEGLLPTPSGSDYYIDVSTRDRSGNSLVYDNVWGISTERFTRPSITTDLFVSDYTCGQNFPFTLGSDARFFNMPPVESYYLNNPGGGGASVTNTFSNVDVWRILCRGPVTIDVLNAYRPTVIKQIDPNNANPAPAPTSTPAPGATATPVPAATSTPTATPLPFSQLTRNVAVSRSAIIWASPYAGTVFAGPGTIADPTTQANLASFLNDGGRLFISGRDIAFALSSAGSQDNSFLNNELAAKYTPDIGNSIQTAEDAGAGFRMDPTGIADLNTLQFATKLVSTGDLNRWNDAAMSPYSMEVAETRDTRFGPGAYNVDAITPTTPDGATIKTAYTSRVGVVGQRIEKNRASGIQSRTVYFSFGFESVNRRYRDPKVDPLGRFALNVRYFVAQNLLRYFKTGGVSGTVFKSSTTTRVANFLVRIDGAGGTFFARTDVNGNYSVDGLPDGGYEVKPYLDGNGLTSPQGFFGGTPRGFFVTGGGGTVAGQDLSVIPTVPGAIIGKVVTSNGTPTIRTDDTPLANLTVLVRSVGESPLFTPTGTGRFARVTTTSATGDFSISNVPAQAEMEVIFNPTQSDVPASSNITLPGNTIKDPKDSRYYDYAGDPSLGRRLLPDTKRPELIVVPSGDNYILDDDYLTADKDTPTSQSRPIIVPQGPTLSGSVTVNGTPVAGVRVELLDSNGASIRPVQTTTSTSGFSFADLRAATPYTLRATYKMSDGLSFVRSVSTTLTRGQDKTVNIDFVLATLTGSVVQGNNVPVSGATVRLQNADGSEFADGTPTAPRRSAKTNASGTYSIPNVPVGGYTYDAATKTFTQAANATSASVVRYNVFASLGSLTGNSGLFSVRATDASVTVPKIQLTNQQLTGLVQLQLDANPVTNLGGATVELLDGSGNSLSPQRTTTTGTDGTYAFANVVAGTYRVRATYRGDTTTSAPFTATSGAYMVSEKLTIFLRTIYGTTFDTSSGSNVATSGATVTLSQNGTVVQTVTSGSGGSFQFQPVAAGSGYVLKATKGTLAGTAAVPTIPRASGQAVGIAVYMKVNTTGTANPTTFEKGRTYSFSTPYATSSDALVRNSYSFMDNRNDATIALSDVFNYGPTGTNAAGNTVRFYTVSRFNPNTLAYEPVSDTGVLSRGEGYLLKVTDVPASGEQLRFETPADNANLKVLTGNDSVAKRFLIALIYNDSSNANGLDGRNFIGFGFDPSKYGSVYWDTTSTKTTANPNAAETTSVQVQYNNVHYTIKDAVTAGLIYPSLTTTDASTGRSVTVTTLNSFGGYFVQARKSGVKLLFQFPQANTN